MKKERACPVCGSKKIKIEKCMDRYTTCLNCGRHKKYLEFYDDELENRLKNFTFSNKGSLFDAYYDIEGDDCEK